MKGGEEGGGEGGGEGDCCFLMIHCMIVFN